MFGRRCKTPPGLPNWTCHAGPSEPHFGLTTTRRTGARSLGKCYPPKTRATCAVVRLAQTELLGGRRHKNVAWRAHARRTSPAIGIVTKENPFFPSSTFPFLSFFISFGSSPFFLSPLLFLLPTPQEASVVSPIEGGQPKRNSPPENLWYIKSNESAPFFGLGQLEATLEGGGSGRDADIRYMGGHGVEPRSARPIFC